MKEFEIDPTTFIGGWYMPDDVCDTLLKLFYNNKQNWKPGAAGRNPGDINTHIKKSTDLDFDATKYPKEFEEYVYNLQMVLELYKQKYPRSDILNRYAIFENPNIQHYEPGEGFYDWHCENSGWGVGLYRHLVFMTYLNTLENAGTEFLYQKTTTPCKKGLTLIWPAGWTHTHRGVTNYESDKYIVTGWYSFENE